MSQTNFPADWDIYQIVKNIFEEQVVFNKTLGMKVDGLQQGNATIEIVMRPDFVGNYTHGMLHGGVISATLDAMGGLVAYLGVVERMKENSLEEKIARFMKIGTIDLRVDYLRPGKGEKFIASGSILRIGNKVAVTRTEFHNDERLLLAVGTGTYLVG